MTVSPPDPRLLVHAYVDGELDPAHVLEMERQFASDPALAAERDRVEALRRAIREQLPLEAAPADLARRIETAVGLRRDDVRTSSHPSWRALAASVVLAVFLASGATWFALRPHPTDATADMIVASHLRALMAPQPFDVASSDRHTVKPWFNGRIPQAPRVVDLAQDGFPLVGGRVDVLARTPVPTLVYRHSQHLISVVAVPVGNRAPTAPSQRNVRGFNVVGWTAEGISYWAVSD